MAYDRSGSVREARPATDRGERIYAIGDIHGRVDLLRDLLGQIEAHSDALPPTASMHVVLLGDLVDRGPASAEVLRFVHGAQKRTDRLIVLLGNHEEMMLKALAGERGFMEAWLRVGGRATLRSFGIEPVKGADPRELTAQFAAVMPREWVEWLRKLPLTARSGDYLFCHAGIRPGVPLKRQARNDLLWIRDDFLEDQTDHGAVVVHGHSIATEVETRPNRIGIDTGAYRTGVLTALYLEGTDRQIIATADQVLAPALPMEVSAPALEPRPATAPVAVIEDQVPETPAAQVPDDVAQPRLGVARTQDAASAAGAGLETVRVQAEAPVDAAASMAAQESTDPAPRERLGANEVDRAAPSSKRHSFLSRVTGFASSRA